LLEIYAHVLHLDAKVFESVLGLVQFVGGVEESLGRNAAYVETGSSQSSSLLDAHSLEAFLTSLDGSHISCNH
jgi:hypothetical protein